jgi:hypothetical protein
MFRQHLGFLTAAVDVAWKASEVGQTKTQRMMRPRENLEGLGEEPTNREQAVYQIAEFANSGRVLAPVGEAIQKVSHVLSSDVPRTNSSFAWGLPRDTADAGGRFGWLKILFLVDS